MAVFKGEFLKTKVMDIGAYIPGGHLTLREPPRKVIMEMKKEGAGGEEPALNSFIKHALGIVTDHDIEDQGGKMDTQKLLNSLFESMGFTVDFIEEVTDFFPQTRRKKRHKDRVRAHFQGVELAGR